jgi:starch synthase
LRILFVSSETYPLIKTGGLADVSGALPAALANMGADIRILMPGYPAVLDKLLDQHNIAYLKDLPEIGSAQLIMSRIAETGVQVMAIVHAGLYQRTGGPYIDSQGHDWADNPLRFGILSKVAALLASSDSPLHDWQPDIVHCNDWQSALSPAFMHYNRLTKPELKLAKSVLSIHNLAFQGNYAPEWVNRLGLPASSFQMHGVEYYGNFGFLKAGIYFADSLSTVSPTYAHEIQTPEFGFGMQGLLSDRSHEIHGILNGIDLDEWNPATDTHLAHTYSSRSLKNKTKGKHALQSQLGLYVDANAPLFGVVSRLTYQKGLDMLLEIAPQILHQGGQIALLGGGEAGLEQAYKKLAQDYPLQVSVNIGYNEPLSHRIMAGADIFVMPSRFEPCGLNQMYGLRYGTPSIVTRTGGLADSIHDTHEASLKNHTATGFVMHEISAYALQESVNRAMHYYHDSKLWHSIQSNGMRQDLGWAKSAQAYLALYQSLL